jgi:hypothetical protein
LQSHNNNNNNNYYYYFSISLGITILDELDESDPRTYEEALNNVDADYWVKAIESEVESIYSMRGHSMGLSNFRYIYIYILRI